MLRPQLARWLAAALVVAALDGLTFGQEFLLTAQRGTPLGTTPLPHGWTVWSFDLR